MRNVWSPHLNLAFLLRPELFISLVSQLCGSKTFLPIQKRHKEFGIDCLPLTIGRRDLAALGRSFNGWFPGVCGLINIDALRSVSAKYEESLSILDEIQSVDIPDSVFCPWTSPARPQFLQDPLLALHKSSRVDRGDFTLGEKTR